MSVQVGQKAPDFTLKTSKMEDFKLSDLQGKRMLSFFSSHSLLPVCVRKSFVRCEIA